MSAAVDIGRVMPAQRPGNSKQDYGTPAEFIAEVEIRFGDLCIDLAAREDNKKAPRCITPEEDSLAQPWLNFFSGGDVGWLNPPFAHIGPWAAKCAEWLEAARAVNLQGRILMLAPASVGSNWYRDHVHGKAYVLFLNDRLTFVGAKDPYPKDCMLCVYDTATGPGFDVWRWK